MEHGAKLDCKSIVTIHHTQSELQTKSSDGGLRLVLDLDLVLDWLLPEPLLASLEARNEATVATLFNDASVSLNGSPIADLLGLRSCAVPPEGPCS